MVDQLKNLARIPDSVCLEVRVMDWIINFQLTLFGVLVFRRLFSSVSIFYSTEHVCLHTVEEKDADTKDYQNSLLTDMFIQETMQ